MTSERLTPDDFIALRSLARHEWREGDMLWWKHNGRWYAVYPTSNFWMGRWRESAYDALERLIAMGLAEKAIRTCCETHWGESVWRLTGRGSRFIEAANARRQAGKHRAVRKPVPWWARWLKGVYWGARKRLVVQ
jgi:hypothetical protein